ncbi:MAG TPA: hypothetical protein VFH04_02205, partial [Nitrososphaeraceae archaeon]|nr:hypothetical protein [Nitrososphaeraceae archaeon]
MDGRPSALSVLVANLVRFRMPVPRPMLMGAVQCTIFLNTYPSLHPSEHMTGETESTTKSEAQLLKQLSRMYEAGISINDISKELKMDQETVKRLLKRLGYASEI